MNRKQAEKYLNSLAAFRGTLVDLSSGKIEVREVKFSGDSDSMVGLLNCVLNELTTAVNVVTWSEELRQSFIQSSHEHFGAVFVPGKTEDSSESFVARNTSKKVVMFRSKRAALSNLQVLARNSVGDEVFLCLHDTVATDRIWNLAKQFPQSK